MNISIVSGQIAKVHVKLETEERFELYGGTDRASFDIAEERLNEFVVTVREEVVAGKPLSRYNVYVRQPSSGREWVVLSGKLLVSPRTADISADKLAPIEYNVTIPVVDNVVDLTGMAIVTGIIGPRGWSAYEIAVQEGFEGTEAEWLESMRQQTATLAVEQVTPLMERAETAADKSEREADAAKTEQETAATHAKAAKESELAAAEHKTAAAGEVTKAAEEVTKAADEVEKAKQEREAAAEHADAAAKSAQDALANQQAAEQAAQDAALAQVEATSAMTDASAAKLAAQTSERNAKASADAAAADKTAAEKAKQDAQAAQSKAEQEAAKAEQNAALLGDAALKSGNNTFSGENNLTGSLSLAGNPAQAAEEMAYWPVAVQAFMVQSYDWSQCSKDFRKLTKPWRFPADMPEPEQIRTTANMRGWFNKGLTFTHFPDSWTFEGLTTIFETFSSNRQLREFPVGVTFSNVTNFSFGLNGCSKLVLSETMDFSNATSVSGAFYQCASIEKLPESLTCKGVTGMHQMCYGCTKLRTVSKDLDLSSINGKTPYIYEGAAAFAFSDCQLEKDSALRVLNTIGTIPEDIREGRSFSLHIGIHIDHQNDEEVLAAISAAESKGWTLTVQWNGTPTAVSTASTFAMGSLIYAKVDEIERPDGTIESRLDWGHYVTDPTGYETFRSLESAYEYFGLPMPEES